MILTYKVKHCRNFSRELELAQKVAEFAINNRDKLSTKHVSHLGLKSVIANQVLRKYGRNYKAKSATSVKLTIPNQGVKTIGTGLVIPCLKLKLVLNKEYEKVNQVELDNKFAYISVSVREHPRFVPEKSIGVDLNTTGYYAVVAVKKTGKVLKLGKQAEHIHAKYKSIRKNLQKKGLYRVVKQIKNREQRIVRDINHKISRTIINLAVKQKGGVKLENLQGIRQTTKSRKSFKYALNSWSFHQLAKFIAYKALLAGVPVTYVEPAYTSKCCSKCGRIGERNNKVFKCPICGYVEHADVNAAFNLAETLPSIVQLQQERVCLQAESGTRQEATQYGPATLEPHWL